VVLMNWHQATREQLLQVALDEDCSFDYKYKACSILQYQQHLNKADHLQEIVYLFAKGMLVSEIAKVLSISHQHVEKIINQKELWRTRLFKEMNSIRRIIQ
jgi:DNA invertase Pin-like site-specific DNA recombinase